MKTNINYTLCLLIVLVFTKSALFAQEHIGPLQYNTRVKPQLTHYSTMRTTALSLPFFEDFDNYDEIPDTNKWIGRQVYINNTMAVNMISRGVATFDALSQYGKPYDTTSPSVIRYADSLSSKIIDLSIHTPGDSIYLSFFYQPAGIGFSPEKSDSLLLYFKSKTSGNWVKVWSKSDTVVQPFRQVMIPVTDTNFLHSNFQFRFVNKASVGINDDIWNLDYIRMDAGRNKFDTAVSDIAYTKTPGNLLKDYYSMPYRQYLANASGERTPNFQSTIRNNYSGSQNIPTFGYVATDFPGGSTLSSDANINLNIPAMSTSDVVFNTYGATPGAGYYDKVIFENKYYLQSPSGDYSKKNDTIIGQQIFDNYLAYDDGTAEMSYYLNLFPTLPGKIAIEHHLNQADTLRGMAIYFGRQVPLASYKYFSIVVYKNIAYGSSATDNIIYQIDNLQPAYRDTVNHFWIYKFDKPVPLPSGTFYIGTTQPALSGSDSLYIGLDRNRAESNHAYYNVLNIWSPSLVSGALMMRPILGQAISGSEIKNPGVSKMSVVNIWPNPATDELNINLPSGDGKVNYEIKNILGAGIQTGKIDIQNGNINISNLAPGSYFIYFRSDRYNYPTQKFIKK
jgi:hypothetical protein